MYQFLTIKRQGENYGFERNYENDFSVNDCACLSRARISRGARLERRDKRNNQNLND